ncbi:MAG: isoprenyl transferase [Lachnospiraceae bacterium]|nr:isoprenyl transferase [Lachnospiraceae bacterium]MBQ2577247.1 isoprenyl transferase [Lachnospiraceae bacterium]MBQ5431413.1 isoprenyl transferase [Lachnospiraceae bacterium]MEE3355427.1 isoprenyl transferase [Candidatus Weimeria sp.]
MPVPKHVSLILDGNGRWAKQKNMPRTYGHMMGAKRVEPIIKAADKMGIRYLSMYAFSTENWNRPKEEVSALMNLLAKYMKICLKLSLQENMRSIILGDKDGLPDALRREALRLEDETKNNTGMTILICINYGSRDEMLRAMRKMMKDLRDRGEDESAITEDLYASYLDTSGIPDPDLMIRTSGEQRLSNYLMWQMAYTEFYFTPVPWPEFTEEHLAEAVMAYRTRNRRYGKV